MKAALGLIKADEGEIYVCGERVVFGETATNRFIGYLPDVPEFYSFMTAREYLKLCGESLNMKKEEIDERSTELLTLVGLADENHRIRGYSRGMKQRLGIAQALLARPKLLICDEPTSALDPIGRKEILDILLSVREQTTVLFSTHILSDVERICTDVAFLDEGRIVMEGKVDELMRGYRKEEFTVKTSEENEVDKLCSAFDDVRKIDKDTVVFVGGQERMFCVLDYIRNNGISLCKIERSQASLESLFMEVIKK
jgi:ABC-2 type transport system ATP-binding protein